VVACLRSGWLTTGPRVKQFETSFAALVGAKHALAVNSCTAALHLAVEALGLRAGQGVLVPTFTFAATAEVVRYQGGVPLLVDCDPVTLNMDLGDAARKLDELRAGRLPLQRLSEKGSDPLNRGGLTPFRIDSKRDLDVVGIIPVHVAGLMMDPAAVRSFAGQHGLWVVEDAAHALPAAYREGPDRPWRRCGEDTARVSCFSFYANKTITTGEGGMAVTDDRKLADRMRQMSLHGLSHDAWDRYMANGAWDYRIVAPGFKYNMTDIAAAMGKHQLQRAEDLRRQRETLARRYCDALGEVPQVELPAAPPDRIHAWHLFAIRLRLEMLRVDRNRFIDELTRRGVGCSVHWRPLHLHPYYEETFHWRLEHFPVATAQWQRVVSLPLFPGMRDEELDYVVRTVRELCAEFSAEEER